MSRNGGYAIMDLSKYFFTSSEEVGVDPSVFDITQCSKPVLISGLTLNKILLPDFYALFLSSTIDEHTSAEAAVVTRSHTFEITIRHDNGTNLTTMTVS